MGPPVRFAIDSGQQNDIAPACGLVQGLPAAQLIADRAYDAISLHDIILERGGVPVFPPRRSSSGAENSLGFAKIASIMIWLK